MCMIRNVLESLFVRVVDLYRSGSNDLVKVIDEADKGGEFKKNAKRVNPKMTTVNKILLNKAVWSVVAANLGMSATIKFPDLGSSLIYGVLSSEIHNPDLDRVIVSNKADETRKVLFKALANMSKKEYIEYDEEWSSLADETENKSNKL